MHIDQQSRHKFCISKRVIFCYISNKYVFSKSWLIGAAEAQTAGVHDQIVLSKFRKYDNKSLLPRFQRVCLEVPWKGSQ